MKLKNAPETTSLTREEIINNSQTPEHAKTFRDQLKQNSGKEPVKKQTKVMAKKTSKALSREGIHFKLLKIGKDNKVDIKMSKPVTMGHNAETGKDVKKGLGNSFDSPYPASKSMLKAMKVLTKHALALSGFPDASTADTTVVELKVSGSMEDHTARISMTVARGHAYSKKPTKIKTDEIPLYTTIVYEKNKELIAGIEDVIEEVWGYMSGEHEFEEQLSFFN